MSKRVANLVGSTEEAYYNAYSSFDVDVRNSGISHYDSASDRGW